MNKSKDTKHIHQVSGSRAQRTQRSATSAPGPRGSPATEPLAGSQRSTGLRPARTHKDNSLGISSPSPAGQETRVRKGQGVHREPRADKPQQGPDAYPPDL